MTGGGPALLRVRRAGDVDLCVALLRVVHEHDRYPYRWPARPREWLRPSSLAQAWLAADDDGVVGHVALCRAEGEDEDAMATWSSKVGAGAVPVMAVSRLFVAPAARGRGTGRWLLGTAVAAARDRGAEPVLEVTSLNADAVGLYRRLGWHEVGSVRRPWLPEDARSLLFVAP
ncbi:MAG: GNAT family N-acetyltransferase [Actinomycetota bacterium]|nr:GNAT family N-acetyltransferase [Actinomycetota bacterium]